MLRVDVDGVGYIGFVDIRGDTSLASLRALIDSTLDTDLVPRYYQFLKPSGVAILARKEEGLLASSFLPRIILLPTPESPIAGVHFVVNCREFRDVYDLLVNVQPR